jgi:hypothetical protein
MLSSMVFGFAVLSSWQMDASAQEITKANWRQHPKIRAVRALVQSIKTDLGSKAYQISRREFEYCEPYQDTLRMMARDARGRVRLYERQGGSEDSALTWQHFYDEQGRLRFVFIQGGAANGSQLEHRIYFDETGKRIWEEHKYVKGPGYTFPTVWPDEELQMTDPAGAFAVAPECPEIKPTARRPKRSDE